MSNPLLDAIARHARVRPAAPALRGSRSTLDYSTCAREVEAAARLLAPFRGVALLGANSPAWAVADLAALAAGTACVPLPAFFSDAQLAHVLQDAGPQAVVSDDRERIERILGARPVAEIAIAGERLYLADSGLPARPLRDGCAKVTYTSGTTGRPKGVCLGAEAMLAVAQSLCDAVGATATDRAVSLLPLSTLLENIGGIYAPLLAGAQATLWPAAVLGLEGGLDLARLMSALRAAQPTTLIVVPQLLGALTRACESGLAPPAGLRFVAVGGAPLARGALERARAAGIPAYEGYGLSEAGSVVTLNSPAADRPGSVGRPLPHARVRIDADGEIVVSGTLFDGYLGTPGGAVSEWRTGDVGYLDGDGYLHVEGRRDSVVCTPEGRNVAPEWVEGELTAQPEIAQAVVFGRGRPALVAVVVPRGPAAAVDAAVRRANAALPPYARVQRWHVAMTPLSFDAGEMTPNGRPRRAVIETRHAAILDQLREEPLDVL